MAWGGPFLLGQGHSVHIWTHPGNRLLMNQLSPPVMGHWLRFVQGPVLPRACAPPPRLCSPGPVLPLPGPVLPRACAHPPPPPVLPRAGGRQRHPGTETCEPTSPACRAPTGGEPVSRLPVLQPVGPPSDGSWREGSGSTDALLRCLRPQEGRKEVCAVRGHAMGHASTHSPALSPWFWEGPSLLPQCPFLSFPRFGVSSPPRVSASFLAEYQGHVRHLLAKARSGLDLHLVITCLLTWAGWSFQGKQFLVSLVQKTQF